MTKEEIWNYLWNEGDGSDLTWESDCEKLAEKMLKDGWIRQVESEWTTRRYTTENDWGIINHREEVCGNCNNWQKEQTNYCCHCGAKMKGVKQ